MNYLLPFSLLFYACSLWISAHVQAQTRPTNPINTQTHTVLVQEFNIANPTQANLEFANSSSPNIGTIADRLVTTERRSAGYCVRSSYIPGNLYSTTSTEPGSLEAWFTSASTPPAPGLRVVIKNVTLMTDEQIPYTDREYNQGSKSEHFFVRFGTRHNEQYLTVDSGKNDFIYEIKQGNVVVETGSFTVSLDKDSRVIQEFHSYQSSYDIRHCADLYQAQRRREESEKIRRRREEQRREEQRREIQQQRRREIQRPHL